jgi:hypothetical protein
MLNDAEKKKEEKKKKKKTSTVYLEVFGLKHVMPYTIFQKRWEQPYELQIYS